MKKFLSLALVGAVVMGVSSVVFANVCAFDPVPAATLLFPFVAYDYNGGTSGATTLFSITNVSSEAQIVHVTLWTDFSIAILDFNILLTGYDVQRMNIRDILGNGELPVTVNSTYAGGVVDDGPVSEANQLNGDWVGGLMADPESTSMLGARCATSDPAYPGQYDDPIDGWILDLFQGWLQSSQTETRLYWDCDLTSPYPGGFWFDTRDDTTPTWMYITADVVETCNKTFPDESGYFTGEARYDNVLMGDVQWVGTDMMSGTALSETDHAVHLEADMDLGMVATASGTLGLPISFYSRYANVLDNVSDFREPLPTAWAFRYQNVDAIDARTYIRAWKGSTDMATIYDLDFTPYNESPTMFVADNCWAYTYYTWDDDEMVESSVTNPWSQPGHDYVVPNLLPLETQEVDARQFNLVGDYGWMLFVWPQSNVDVVNIPAPPAVGTPDYYQTWMGVKYTGFNQFSAGMSGTVMANYNCFSQQVLPDLGVNFEYVDTLGYVVSANLP